MSRRSRRLDRSPQLRVLACLAWLLLVIVPAYGLPSDASGDMHHTGHATHSVQTAQTVDHCHHAAPVKLHRSCCDTHDTCCASHACGCGTGCNSALAMPITHGFARPRIASEHGSTRDANVPNSAFPPLLRPPAA